MSVLMIILSILLIIGGVNCMATPVATFSMLGWLVGLAIIITGVTAIFRYASGKNDRSIWELIGGIAGILFGGFVVVNSFAQFATNMVIAYAAAVWLIIYGISGIVEALDLRRINKTLPNDFRTAGWLVVMILGISTAVIGVICIFQPMVTVFSVGLLIGLSILISGIKTLVLSIQIIRDR